MKALTYCVLIAAISLPVHAGDMNLPSSPPPNIAARSHLATAVQSAPVLTARQIIENAHRAAGGETWVRPSRLKLTGYNLIRRGTKEVIWDKYAMWRQYANQKSAAHKVDGKIRIEAWSQNKLTLLLTFDGEKTYNQDGPLEDQSANAMWGANFGYGAIRNALDQGWQQKRLPDDLIDGKPSYMVELTDPSAGVTRFGIRQSDSRIVYVGFNTPRGWHERRYSNFFSKPGISWLQPGRVRLFYDGVKANEAIWTNFELLDASSKETNEDWSDDLFQVKRKPDLPSF